MSIPKLNNGRCAESFGAHHDEAVFLDDAVFRQQQCFALHETPIYAARAASQLASTSSMTSS
jgi:hypothetical protein